MAAAKEIYTPTVTLSAAEKEQNLRRLMREMPSVLVVHSADIDGNFVSLIIRRAISKPSARKAKISYAALQNQRIEIESYKKEQKLNKNQGLPKRNKPVSGFSSSPISYRRSFFN